MLTDIEIYKTLARIEGTVNRLDERSKAQATAITDLKSTRSKVTGSIILSLLSIIGTGTLLVIGFLI